MTRIASRAVDAPPPAGPYSSCVRIGDIVAAAGQAGFDATGALVDGIAAQTRQTLRNLLANLESGGATSNDVISVRVFLTDPSQFAVMNEAYAEFFDDPYPARTTVYVTLPPGMLVEIDALAVLPDERTPTDAGNTRTR
jgi:2-iminobutanoate/2-iminopropanoate deaminase